MDEVKELESEDGMLLDIPGFTNGLLVRGFIAAVCADSKAAHELGGFLSPSANKFCRLCLIDRKDIKNCNCFDQLNMRNRNNYEDAVKESSDCIEKRNRNFKRMSSKSFKIFSRCGKLYS